MNLFRQHSSQSSPFPGATPLQVSPDLLPLLDAANNLVANSDGTVDIGQLEPAKLPNIDLTFVPWPADENDPIAANKNSLVDGIMKELKEFQGWTGDVNYLSKDCVLGEGSLLTSPGKMSVIIPEVFPDTTPLVVFKDKDVKVSVKWEPRKCGYLLRPGVRILVRKGGKIRFYLMLFPVPEQDKTAEKSA